MLKLVEPRNEADLKIGIYKYQIELQEACDVSSTGNGQEGEN